MGPGVLTGDLGFTGVTDIFHLRCIYIKKILRLPILKIGRFTCIPRFLVSEPSEDSSSAWAVFPHDNAQPNKAE